MERTIAIVIFTVGICETVGYSKSSQMNRTELGHGTTFFVATPGEFHLPSAPASPPHSNPDIA